MNIYNLEKISQNHFSFFFPSKPHHGRCRYFVPPWILYIEMLLCIYSSSRQKRITEMLVIRSTLKASLWTGMSFRSQDTDLACRGPNFHPWHHMSSSPSTVVWLCWSPMVGTQPVLQCQPSTASYSLVAKYHLEMYLEEGVGIGAPREVLGSSSPRTQNTILLSAIPQDSYFSKFFHKEKKLLFYTWS